MISIDHEDDLLIVGQMRSGGPAGGRFLYIQGNAVSPGVSNQLQMDIPNRVAHCQNRSDGPDVPWFHCEARSGAVRGRRSRRSRPRRR